MTSSDTSTLDLLRKARGLLAERELSQGPMGFGLAREGQKAPGEVMPWQDNYQVQAVSIVGAIAMAAGCWPDEEPAKAAVELLKTQLVDHYLSVEVYNDDTKVDKDQALALFDKALEQQS